MCAVMDTKSASRVGDRLGRVGRVGSRLVQTEAEQRVEEIGRASCRERVF